jgi:predicted outer membrane repeat protein
MRRPNLLVKRLRKWFSGARARRARNYRPCLEELETRQLLSTFTVVLATDSGGTGGQMVTATSGDLRYCIAQANASHSATSDTITFDPTLFATPHTITLDSAKGTLMLSDSHPLTIQGPSGRTATVSGGDAVEVLDITSGTVNISNLAISHGNASKDGGGISNSGALTLTNCTLDHDVAARFGGGLVNLTGSATLNGCVLTHDSALDGGGIFNSGALTLTNCNLSDDSASGVGGGGIYMGGSATVTGTTFDNDSAPDEDGGGVFIVGNSNTPSKATFTNCTFTNDSAGNGGGGLCTDGICTVIMTNCNISNDTAFQGGGLCSAGSGHATVTLTLCTLSNDTCTQNGGGGGFLNQGTATVTACTFSNDSAYEGGGILNEGLGTMVNCTFANNKATANGGGAIYNGPYGSVYFTLNVTNCTIAGNSALHSSGGGIYNVTGSTLNLYNTLVAENIAASGPDVSGTIHTADHNLIGDASGCSITTNQGGNLMGGNGKPVIDPRLGPLQNNGGTTETLALFADSPAIDHGDSNAPGLPKTDQRGHPRIVGSAVDIGAYEYP